jgi:tetratricopeptide (TPR) repeat protein
LDKQENKEILLQKNHNGLTPLDLAAQESNVGCVLLLLPETDGKTLTVEDAKAYIDDYKKTKTTIQSTAPPEVKEEAEKSSQVADTSEEDAQRKAAQIASSPDPSEDNIKKAVEFKAQGNTHFVKKEREQALEFYSKAIQSNPKEATFYSNRSACYMVLNRPGEALEDAVVARTLRPTWSKACYRMAVARLELGRYEDAALAAWEGLQLDQENEELKSFLQKCVKKGRKDFHSSKGNAAGSR